ncbi:MAG: ABC transporter ATP-binding protein [Planctomycetota bacterium]|jgi:ABC-2 type transport system ATP-binding protein
MPDLPATAPIASLRRLGKSYGFFAAVDDLDLDVGRGEILALLGPNGAGKTTTIRMLMGILSPTSGEARVAGLDCFAERPEVMRHVGYLPDEPIFHDHLRGSEVLAFCATMHGLPRAAAKARAEALAERLGLAGDLDEFAVNYSLGMRKKLALIAAMLHEPELLILDEPTNGLDPVVTRALLDLVREQAAAGRAVFYSTHLLDQAQRLCHRVAILHKGRLMTVGTAEELVARHAPGGTLEDVFFRVTGAAAEGGA